MPGTPRRIFDKMSGPPQLLEGDAARDSKRKSVVFFAIS
jgi:hypothetical protein